jgi:hypothetical protein
MRHFVRSSVLLTCILLHTAGPAFPNDDADKGDNFPFTWRDLLGGPYTLVLKGMFRSNTTVSNETELNDLKAFHEREAAAREAAERGAAETADLQAGPTVAPTATVPPVAAPEGLREAIGPIEREMAPGGGGGGGEPLGGGVNDMPRMLNGM